MLISQNEILDYNSDSFNSSNKDQLLKVLEQHERESCHGSSKAPKKRGTKINHFLSTNADTRNAANETTMYYSQTSQGSKKTLDNQSAMNTSFGATNKTVTSSKSKGGYK